MSSEPPGARMSDVQTASTIDELRERHAATLDGALAAIAERGYWSPYPEVPKAYGETALADGRAAFEALLDKPFELDQAGTSEWVGAERSPFGIDLGITYPRPDLDVLLP